MNATIRTAVAADLDAVAPLFDAYRQFYGQPADPARARAFIGERLRRGDAVILLALRDGTAAGFAQLYPLFSSVRTGRIWQLNDLYVAPSARRHGVGRALLAAARDHAAASGALGLQLETQRSNTAAQRLYAAHGWQRDDSSHVYTLTV
ncbi:MAG: GNAT family N-acetyltransferase [Xanthomonadaceae bacterium]|nr:GNAT family N-acetyltransferase [Xanthomonadaceae bacterium]MDE2178500.1 GNAT family N-acetyltransferase [Xanthomonadaceae bacterium]MDE2245279.1 GNAT family N-acetyltransferase [Xanthomonadaceae bacterium]